MENQGVRTGFAARGRRYSPAERAQILKDAMEFGVSVAAEKHGCSKWTIYDWRAKERLAAQRECEPGGADESSADSLRDDRHRLILELWRQHPGLGPSQIRNLLKRKGFKASVNTVRAIMEEHGYVHPKLRRKEHTGRYEAIRPLQLVHLDFYHFHVHRQKQCLLMILDDFSAFHSFKGVSRFERLLEELEISHFLAQEPAVNDYASHCTSFVRSGSRFISAARRVSFRPWAFAGGFGPGSSYR